MTARRIPEKKAIAGAALVVALAVSLCGCQLLFQETAELYVSVDGDYDASVTCELYLIERLDVGRSAGTGDGILGEMLRTETISGREWMVFEVPRGRWDIYMEYFTYGAYRDYSVDRNTVDLDNYEWAALWLPTSDWTSTRRYQGDGEVIIPGV